MRDLMRDLQYALRQLRMAPAFAATVIVTLGLGIGATSAIFSLMDGLMRRPLPVVDPGRLFVVGERRDCCATTALQGDWERFSYDFYQRVKEASPEFEEVAAFQSGGGVLSVRESEPEAQARPMLGEYVSGNYFRMLGLRALTGRLLVDSDDRHGASPAVVLSERVWREKFHADPGVVGSVLMIERHPFTVVGVAPAGFFGETLSGTPTEIWVTLEAEYVIDGEAAFNALPAQAWLHMMGRLREGANADAAAARMTALLQHWLTAEAALAEGDRPFSAEELGRQRIHVAPGGTGVGTMRRAYAESLRLLLALCGAVLGIACANVANLLLARGIGRRAQVAVRMALGASRRRIVLDAMTEALLLAGMGGLAGVGIAWAGARVGMALIFRHAAAVPVDVRPSLAVVGFSVGLGVVTGLVSGAIPAWLASRAEPMEALRGGGRGMRAGAGLPQRVLVVAQAGLSVVLLSAAGMLAHSMVNLERQRLGFATEGRVSVTMEPPLADLSFEELSERYRVLLEGLRAVPGVESASLGLTGPVGGGWRETIVLPGEGLPRTDGSQNAGWNRVSPGYFATAGLPVLEGRGISEQDRADTRGVVVVNEAFVRRFFKGGPALGRHLGMELPEYADSLEVVGVVGNARSGDLKEAPGPMVYGALTQRVAYREEMLRQSDKWDHFISDVQLRIHGGLGVMEPGIREAFRRADVNFAIIAIDPLQEVVDERLDQQSAVAELSGIFGGLALGLASVGLYGVTAYAVARRRGEIGIRMALGAGRGDVAIWVLRGAFGQVAAGLVLGIPLAMLAGRLLQARLYGVGVMDGAAMGLAVGLLALGAVLACVAPARQAARTDPMEALRAE